MRDVGMVFDRLLEEGQGGATAKLSKIYIGFEEAPKTIYDSVHKTIWLLTIYGIINSST